MEDPRNSLKESVIYLLYKMKSVVIPGDASFTHTKSQVYNKCKELVKPSYTSNELNSEIFIVLDLLYMYYNGKINECELLGKLYLINQ